MPGGAKSWPAAATPAAAGPEISPWCHSAGKRAMDLVGALAALLPGLPLMAAIAVAVKLGSRGPVLFRQARVGQHGRLFEVLKFRTMTHDPRRQGPGVTRRGDARVTAVGRVLRACKLDELPQFLNVLWGDMSLVGPRPDLPQYMNQLQGERRAVLQLRPGITSVASLSFRDEEALLAQVPEARLQEHYLKVVLPQKIDLDLNYARRATWFSDLGLVFRTALALAPARRRPDAVSQPASQPASPMEGEDHESLSA